MTDPMNVPTSPPPAAPPPAPAASPMSGMLSSMSRAELFIAAGAALILVTDLIFTVFGAYGSTNIVWAAAAVALVLILTHSRVSSMSLSDSTYRALLLVTGFVALLAGIRDLLYDIQYFPGRPVDITYMLGALGLYVGVALMAFGAWQLWSRRAT
jgi:hypothetical protein